MLHQQQRSTTGKKTRGKYHTYSSEERAVIGKYATENGISAARRVFSRKLGMKLSNSTVSGMKAAYKHEVARKRERGEEEDEVLKLPEKKRGRHVLLGERLDKCVQEYVLKVHERGCAVNSALVVAGATGIVQSLDRSRLAEYGGHVTLNISWARSLLKRMNFTQRRATTKCGIPPQIFQQVKSVFARYHRYCGNGRNPSSVNF